MVKDIRYMPTYGLVEAAHYLRIPVGTLRWWVYGQPYRHVRSIKRYKPIIEIPKQSSEKNQISFINLAEAYILDAIRRDHKISLQKVRIALDYLEKEFESKNPLIEHSFETDGLDLFITQYGKLISITKKGQTVMRELIKAYLERIEYDEKGMIVKLFPFIRKRPYELDEPKVIVIDPNLSFGRPVLAGTGIPTNVIAERYKAGESMGDLANDYNRSVNEIEEAIRCELEIKAA